MTQTTPKPDKKSIGHEFRLRRANMVHGPEGIRCTCHAQWALLVIHADEEGNRVGPSVGIASKLYCAQCGAFWDIGFQGYVEPRSTE